MEHRDHILSVLAPLRDLLDSEKCAAWLMEELHGFPPEQAVCIGCGKALSEKLTTSLRAGRRVQCYHCSKHFNAWTGTILQGAHMTAADFILFRLAVAAGLDPAGLIQLTGRHSQFVSTWGRKVQAFNDDLQETRAHARANFPPTTD